VDAPRKILFILNSLMQGGAEKVMVTLLNGLDTSEFALSLLYLRKKEGILGELNQSRLRSIHCYGGTNSVEFGLPFYIASQIRREQIQTVVCVGQRPMLYALLARSLVRRRVRIIQSIHVPTLFNRFQRCKNFLLYRRLFKHCDPVIFVSEQQRKRWASSGFMDVSNSVCIHNGIDVDHFNDRYSPEEKAEIRLGLGFSESDYVVGIFARLDFNKNHHELVAAVEKIRSTGIGARLLIVGDGPARAGLEALAESMGLERDVVFTGFRKDIRPLMSISDCIALTSRAESFPVSILEAMAMGKPVISSASGGVLEQIRHGETGFLYNSGNVEELESFLKILSAPAIRAEMGQRARQDACARFDRRRMILEYARVLAGKIPQ